jgi:predicted AAA+ superfamily ATPase
MERYNPWWVGEEDTTYLRWKSYRVKWIPDVVERITFNPFSLHFLVGPRQVGKTTALKLCVQRLLKERNPRSIFYFPCDELSDYRELGEVLDSYLSAARAWGITQCILFLDEVTFVEEWWRAVKVRIDSGALLRHVVVVSGSSSLDLLAQKEKFPGRRGSGMDIYMLPMDFASYVRKLGGLETKTGPASDLEGIERNMKANSLFASRISELFRAYLKTGGFPVPIRELFEQGRVSVETQQALLEWLRSDWRKAGKSDGYMKAVISYILGARLSPISWLGIAKETSLGSPHTAQSYVECLQDLQVVKVLHLLSPDGRVEFRKNKKVHFLDPFLYSVFSSYTGVEVLEETLAESVLVCHLSRVFDTYYWRDGSEVDAVSLVGGQQVGFEVKWGPRSWRRPAHLKRTFLLTEETLPLLLSSVTWDKV